MATDSLSALIQEDLAIYQNIDVKPQIGKNWADFVFKSHPEQIYTLFLRNFGAEVYERDQFGRLTGNILLKLTRQSPKDNVFDYLNRVDREKGKILTNSLSFANLLNLLQEDINKIHEMMRVTMRHPQDQKAKDELSQELKRSGMVPGDLLNYSWYKEFLIDWMSNLDFAHTFDADDETIIYRYEVNSLGKYFRVGLIIRIYGVQNPPRYEDHVTIDKRKIAEILVNEKETRKKLYIPYGSWNGSWNNLASLFLMPPRQFEKELVSTLMTYSLYNGLLRHET